MVIAWQLHTIGMFCATFHTSEFHAILSMFDIVSNCHSMHSIDIVSAWIAWWSNVIFSSAWRTFFSHAMTIHIWFLTIWLTDDSHDVQSFSHAIAYFHEHSIEHDVHWFSMLFDCLTIRMMNILFACNSIVWRIAWCSIFLMQSHIHSIVSAWWIPSIDWQCHAIQLYSFDDHLDSACFALIIPNPTDDESHVWTFFHLDDRCK